MPPRIIAIDWSGALRGARRKIWLAEAVPDRVVSLECGRNREEITTHVIGLASKDADLIVGLDFAFSFPSWFLADLNIVQAHDLWALAKQDVEAWLSKCDPPFWGRPGTKCSVPRERRFRRTELETPGVAGIRPKSVFQINGAGAVGTGSLRGMSSLGQLAQAGFSIWPFDPPNFPMALEIWPRVLTGPITKSSVQERAEYLDRSYRNAFSPDDCSKAVASEDAFDAAVSALKMAEHRAELLALKTVTDAELLLEGVIWHPQWSAP